MSQCLSEQGHKDCQKELLHVAQRLKNGFKCYSFYLYAVLFTIFKH
jgi:hypothetical protein